MDDNNSSYNGAYKDIINLERPKHINDAFSAKHPAMRREDRAKIFSSFAALKGYEDSINTASIDHINSFEKPAEDDEDLYEI